jgi:hypothetical protein
MRKGIMTVVAVLGVVGLLAAAPMASAKGGNDVIKRGSCSGTSDWKLKLSPQNGNIEVEYEVDSNVVGQTWRVRLFHDGTRFFAGTKVTKAPSGSFTVRKVVANHAGTDTIKGRAVNVKTGETCVGKASI